MTVTIHTGDCREVLVTLPAASVDCVVTSPPYFGLRDYGNSGQIGLEATPEAYVAEMVAVFREVRRVLRDDGTLWLNLGDSYSSNGGPGWQGSTGPRDGGRFTGTRNTVAMREQARTAFQGLKPKDLIGIPWRVAFALQADGWYLRQDIIWSKPNPMPESVRDRCTKAHEYIFLLSKSSRYYYDAVAIAEPIAPSSVERLQPGANLPRFGGGKYGENDAPEHRTKLGNEWKPSGARNRRSVWAVTTKPFTGAHFATFPPGIPEICIKAGCRIGGVILDPFGGAGTTGLVADRLGRHAILIELNPDYAEMARQRLASDAPLLAEVL